MFIYNIGKDGFAVPKHLDLPKYDMVIDQATDKPFLFNTIATISYPYIPKSITTIWRFIHRIIRNRKVSFITSQIDIYSMDNNLFPVPARWDIHGMSYLSPFRLSDEDWNRVCDLSQQYWRDLN